MAFRATLHPRRLLTLGLPRVQEGQVEAISNMGFVCHHLIHFTGEALRGEHNASCYAAQDVKRKEALAGPGGAGGVSASELK